MLCLEHAGVSAIQIEDQVVPKRAHYHRGVIHVRPLDEYLAKLKVLMDERTDPDLLIFGRVDAGRSTTVGGSYEEGARRAKAIVEAGVDVLQLSGWSFEDAKRIRKEIPNIPIHWGRSVKLAKEIGTQVVVSTTPIMVEAYAMEQHYKKLLETGECANTELPPEVQEMAAKLHEWASLPKYWEIEERTTEKEG